MTTDRTTDSSRSIITRRSKLLTAPMSTLAVRMLRHMLDSDLTPYEVKRANQMFIGVLLRRRLAKEVRGGGIGLTPVGVDVARSYGGRETIKRLAVDEDVSETVKRLLLVSRQRARQEKESTRTGTRYAKVVPMRLRSRGAVA